MIRRELINPQAIRETVDQLNSDIAQRAKDRGPDLDRARQRLAGLERQDANLRRVLRTATPRVAERIVAEMEDVAPTCRLPPRRSRTCLAPRSPYG